MKFKSFVSSVATALVLSVSTFSANAGLLTWNGNEIEALDLNGSYASFEEFFDYNNAKPYSSDTGFEQDDTVVLFIAELNNEYGVFGTISNYFSGSVGALTMAYSGTDGTMLFVDDPAEAAPGSISFTYGSGRSDGFLYGDLFDTEWDFTLDFSSPTNIDGVQFVSFDGGDLSGAEYSALSSINDQYIISNDVSGNNSDGLPINAPGTLVMLSMSLVFLSLRRGNS
ncbi:MAG: hypothetical protein HWE26_10900 [Alteromonadaceae bacterium]|nr:hypothetical protein [Alteromonadaceae bacterium]